MEEPKSDHCSALMNPAHLTAAASMICSCASPSHDILPVSAFGVFHASDPRMSRGLEVSQAVRAGQSSLRAPLKKTQELVIRLLGDLF